MGVTLPGPLPPLSSWAHSEPHSPIFTLISGHKSQETHETPSDGHPGYTLLAISSPLPTPYPAPQSPSLEEWSSPINPSSKQVKTFFVSLRTSPWLTALVSFQTVSLSSSHCFLLAFVLLMTSTFGLLYECSWRTTSIQSLWFLKGYAQVIQIF